LNELFRRFAQNAAVVLGTVWAFVLAVAVIVVWALLGPAAGFSETWQLIINTGTTIVTFLMVFIIQNTQNRDARAIHLKLDELVKAAEEARNDLIDIEGAPEEELLELQREFTAERERNGGASAAPDPVKPPPDAASAEARHPDQASADAIQRSN
jgi:low affinity Fe/Cu permease